MTARAEPGQQERDAFISLFNARRYPEASALAKQMAARFPQDVFSWKALGASYREMGRGDEALVFMQQALSLAPADAETHCHLGNVLKDLGRFEQAEKSYRRAIGIRPDYASAHLNLGSVLAGLGRGPEAETCYRKAIAIRPDYALAHNDLGLLLEETDRLEEAAASYRKVLEIGLRDAAAHSHLGNLLHAAAHNNLGRLLNDLGRPREAEASFRRSLQIWPDFGGAYSNLLFMQVYYGQKAQADYLAEARGYEVKTVPAEARAAAKAKRFERAPRAGRRLRIGYVSGDFRAHAVSCFFEQILRAHDRSRLELFAYATLRRRDAVTDRMQSCTDHWNCLDGVSDDAATEVIFRDDIDVLVDLSGHTAHNRLGIFARRAAPVQCHYLGYFASTGLSEMDYWIGDPLLTPVEHANQFSETMWRLPRVWVSYAPPGEAPEPAWQPDAGSKVCLGSFNHMGKITERTIALWARLLRGIPEARLMLKTKLLDDPANRARLYAAFREHAIPESRIELLGRTADWRSHMALYGRLAVALDPLGGLGGGTTTCDALWMGVPVVTLAGGRAAERMSASMLEAIGRGDWVAKGEDEYLEIVARLAAEEAPRKELRFGLRETMRASPLCDAAGLARALEDAYEAMFDQWSKR
jgi:protein O-GlcNAc transferase